MSFSMKISRENPSRKPPFGGMKLRRGLRKASQKKRGRSGSDLNALAVSSPPSHPLRHFPKYYLCGARSIADRWRSLGDGPHRSITICPALNLTAAVASATAPPGPSWTSP